MLPFIIGDDDFTQSPACTTAVGAGVVPLNVRRQCKIESISTITTETIIMAVSAEFR